MVGLNPRKGTKGALEFEAFAVVAAKSDRMNGADAEGDEIVENGPGSAGLASDSDDVVNGETGFDRDLGSGWVDFEIAVEAEVSEQEDV